MGSAVKLDDGEERVSLTERAYARIRQRILDNEWPAGSLMPSRSSQPSSRRSTPRRRRGAHREHRIRNGRMLVELLRSHGLTHL